MWPPWLFLSAALMYKIANILTSKFESDNQRCLQWLMLNVRFKKDWAHQNTFFIKVLGCFHKNIQENLNSNTGLTFLIFN